MRLNRVESFYAFLLYFYNELSEERGSRPLPGPLQGRPATARPGPYRGGRSRPAHKWQCSPAARLQGQRPRLARRGAAPTEAPPAGMVLACRKGSHPWAGRSPTTHRATARTGATTVQRGQEGPSPLFAPFCAAAPTQAAPLWASPLSPSGLAAGSGQCFCPQAAFLSALRLQLTTRLWAATPAGGDPLQGAWPQLVVPAGDCCPYGWQPLVGGLAVAGRSLTDGRAMPDCPSSMLPSLRKCCTNAYNDST
ncbi:hypothetical protein BHM03_00028389 [Ensete ventricosum]|nr:hypothetical protein BHM03_00028389 [Ensete ventricosum]